MTNRELADALHKADTIQDPYLVPELESEVAERLGLDPDDTEQGLSSNAAAAVDAFIRQHATPEPEWINGLS